jgi:UDP-GlcNAc:undecaprenyl-phosphate GlcNAc-1-phosphate transferase
MGSEPTIFLLACLVSLGLTALVREIAPRIGLTDDPDGHRKLHGRATPLGGGVAIYLTTAVILGTLWLLPGEPPPFDDAIAATAASDTAKSGSADATTSPADAAARTPTDESAGRPGDNLAPRARDMSTKLRVGYKELPALLLAGLIIVLVGLVDDWKGLRGRVKLAGQAVAVSVLIAGGVLIRRIDIFGCQVSFEVPTYSAALFGHEIFFAPLAYLVTLFWLLGAINALNLLDGIDGLATILGIILSCTIAAMAIVMAAQGATNQGVAIIAMVLVGSLLGFLRFNFPPASIFLGDSGSMLIGLVVGALAIGGSLKGPGTVLLAAPLAIWTLPFFDSAAAILRRKLTGRSIYDTDRGHLHHRLMNLLGSNRKVLGWVAACCAVIAVATLVGLIRKDDRIMLLTCLGIVAIFIATGIFGRVELLLVGTRLRGIGRSLVSPMFPQHGSPWQTSVHLQGNEQWDLLWATFVESADKLRLIKIRLDVNIPTLAEAYHASWERPSSNAGHRWHVEIPLVLNDRAVGMVRITGRRNHQSASSDIQQLMELIEPFELRLQSLSTDLASRRLPGANSGPGHNSNSQISSAPAKAAPK